MRVYLKSWFDVLEALLAGCRTDPVSVSRKGFNTQNYIWFIWMHSVNFSCLNRYFKCKDAVEAQVTLYRCTYCWRNIKEVPLKLKLSFRTFTSWVVCYLPTSRWQMSPTSRPVTRWCGLNTCLQWGWLNPCSAVMNVMNIANDIATYKTHKMMLTSISHHFSSLSHIGFN